MAWKFLERKGYRNAKVMREGIPGWQARGYPMERRRAGVIEHRPYPAAVAELGKV